MYYVRRQYISSFCFSICLSISTFLVKMFDFSVFFFDNLIYHRAYVPYTYVYLCMPYEM